MQNQEYPVHLSDPLRVRIAVEYARHEMRKLFPRIRDAATLAVLDDEITRWPELLSVRDFWNGVHGISMGFRLKNIVSWLTSLNIRWEKREVDTADLWFGGSFGPIPKLGSAESAGDVAWKLFLSENIKLLEEVRKTVFEKSNDSAPRSEYPLFVVRKEDELRVIDGNRRLLQAIVNERPRISIYVGEPISSPVFYEHWVPTSLMVDLAFWHKKEFLSGRSTTQEIAHVIAELIRDSS
ncbi:MAG: hypothetical protein KGI60_02720, partial [Patescibacteria group bacterium]|nr:hypothetical protein [Patescibacteria group bacterium]